MASIQQSILNITQRLLCLRPQFPPMKFINDWRHRQRLLLSSAKNGKSSELSLFGSILRSNFRAIGDDPSDIDLLYVSTPEARYGFKVFEMKAELEQLLNCKVDLISKRGIQASRNLLRRKAILESAQMIYAKRSAINS